MLMPILDDHNWKEVFKYAQPHGCGAEHQHGPEAIICSTVNTDPFEREDVAFVIAMVNGENDGPSWVGAFRLNDGRYVSIRAGCDYTGWG